MIETELPHTRQALIVYIEYAKKQIHLNELHNKRLMKRIEKCQALLERDETI